MLKERLIAKYSMLCLVASFSFLIIGYCTPFTVTFFSFWLPFYFRKTSVSWAWVWKLYKFPQFCYDWDIIMGVEVDTVSPGDG